MFTLVFFVLPSDVWGATIYVSPGTNSGIMYKSGSWPTTIDNDADDTDMEAVSTVATSGDIIEIDGGVSGNTYSGTTLGADGRWDSGAGEIIKGSTEVGHNGTVTLSTTNNDAIYFNYGTLQNITLIATNPGDYGLYLNSIASGSQIITDVIITGSDRGIRVQNTSQPATFTRVTVKDSTNINTQILAGSTSSSTATITFTDCKFTHNAGGYVFNTYNATAININNSLFIGNEDGLLRTISSYSGPVTFTNIITSANAYVGNSILFTEDGGQIIVNNSILLPKGMDPLDWTWDTEITESNNVYLDPLFTRHRRTGIIVTGADDYENFEYWKDVADVHNTYGVPTTWFMSSPQSFTEWADLQTYVDAGHGVTSHSRRHIDTANMEAFSIQYTGDATTATVDVNLTTNKITTTLAGDQTDGSANLNINITPTGIYNTITKIITYINQQTGYTAVSTSISNHNDSALNTNLVDITPQDINGVAYPLLLDETLFYAEELAGSKEDIEAGLNSFTCDTYAYPYNSWDSGARDGLQTAGYLGAKGDIGDINLTDTEVYSIRVYNIESQFGSGNKSVIQKNISALVNEMLDQGEIVVLQSHNATESTLQDWQYVLEIISNSDIYMMTLSDAVQHIRGLKVGVLPTSVDAGDGQQWTRTFTDNSDYTLKVGYSPAVDAGVSIIGRSSDFLGNSIYGTPDIGAYEYQPPYTIGTHNIPTTGSTRIYTNGKYRMKTASTTADTTSFTITPPGGNYQATTTQYMDLTIDTWATTGNQNKQWTATSTAGSFLTKATTTIYTIGDLLPNTYYQFKLDGTASTTAVTSSSCNSNGTCLSDSSGNLTFNYVGGYSTHIFALEKDITGPTSFNLATTDNIKTSNTQPTLTWDATTDSSSTLSKYQLYVDGSLDTDNISSSTTSATPANSLSCGNHTWYVKAVDSQGNGTNSSTRTITMVCDAGVFTGTLATPIELTPRLQTVYPDGTVVYHDEEDFTLPSVSVSDSSSDLQNSESSTVQETTSSEEQKQTQTITTTHIFTKTQIRGLKGTEVTKLQQILRELNFFTYPTNTGYYGTITETAVKQFQCNQNIVCTGTPQTTGYGLVGPKTRKTLNSLQETQIKEETKTEEVIQTKTEEEQITELEKQISEMLKMVEMLRIQLKGLSD